MNTFGKVKAIVALSVILLVVCYSGFKQNTRTFKKKRRKKKKPKAAGMMSPGWWLSNHKLCVLYFWRVALSWTGGQLNIRCSIINTCARLSNHHPEGNAALSFNSMLAVEEKLKCERKKGPYFISGSWTPFVVNYLHLTVMWKCLTLKITATSMAWDQMSRMTLVCF